MNAREVILNMLEAITGARMTYNYVRIGGVWADLPMDFERKMEASMEEFNRLHHEFLDLLEEAQIFRIRTQGIGKLSKELALDYGTVGPVARASGIDYDVRRDDPYFGYDELKFRVPVRTEGDSFARYRVRLEEMQESINIAWQAWDKYNELKATDPYRLEKLPRRPNTGEVYRRIETGRGEGGFYIMSDGKPEPYRVRIKSPVFNNLRTLTPLIVGGKLADIPAVMGSIDLCVGDLDR
jgi:NADH:ubiquinone oxidoreductase subunit D